MRAGALKGVVFDMDGTLVDSLGVVVDCYRRAVLELDGPDHSPDQILASFRIGPTRAMLAELIGRPVGDEAVARYEALLAARCEDIHPYPGVADAIARLAATLPLAVFTAADTSAANTILDAGGLTPFFASVIGADLVARTKPAPDGLIEVARRLGLHPSAVAYVGDGPSDVATARSCGALAIAAGWGHQHDPGRRADLVVDSPGDLVALLLELAAPSPASSLGL